MLLASPDRSDAGLRVGLLSKAFGGDGSLDIDLGAVTEPIAACFAEELGAVLQVPAARAAAACAILARHGLGALCRDIGAAVRGSEIRLHMAGRGLFVASRLDLH